MKKIMNLALSTLIMCIPMITLAHPGHGETEGFSIIHYMVEPNHEIVVAAVLVVVGVYFFLLRRNRQSQKK